MRKILLVFLIQLPLLLLGQVQDDKVIENDTITGRLTVKAANSITIKPTTIIRAGSDFTAQIISDLYLPLSLNNNENYVFTRDYQIATTSTTVAENSDVIESIAYFDGLGRAKQSIGIKQSPTKKDIVTHVEYDDLGRQVDEFLPYVTTQSNGAIVSGAKTATQQYYKTNYVDDFPGVTEVNLINAFSRKEFDNSPLNRVEKQAAPGYDWRLNGGHEIKFDYQTNSANEVRLFTVSITASNNVFTPSLAGGTSYYAAGELYKTVTKDENHAGTASTLHTTEEFKNKQGQVVLKRTYALVGSNSEAHDTYYVYDDFGNLTYVLPPKVDLSSGVVTSTELSELCYQYEYDYRNRLVKKKIPGKEWEYIVYDKLDRPVLTQDAYLRRNNRWLFTKYDALGRIVYTGIYKHSSALSQLAMQTLFNTENSTEDNTESNTASKYYETKLASAGTQGVYYSSNNFPSTNLEVLTVNYYDNYTFDVKEASTTVALYNNSSQNSTSRLKGLVTGSKVKVLDTDTDQWITTVTCYDEKAHPVYVYSHNEYLGTTDIMESELDFVGKVLETKASHTKSGNTAIVTVDSFEYDHAARLKSQKQKINSQEEEVIVSNNYDELGQLINKEVGGGLQKVDYKYNVRGWLTNINDDANNDNDLFNFSIKYNRPTSGGVALFNGNISQTSWNSLSESTAGGTALNEYSYAYDALNRLTAATGTETPNYNVSGISYDKNGNILTLKRKGHTNIGATSFGDMDDLSYTYVANSNKLSKVTDNAILDQFGFKDDAVNTTADTANDYSYDANGNMRVDTNKGITQIDYNHLNLPTIVRIGNSDISYTYDASGVKLSKSVFIGGATTTTQYAGNYIYERHTPPAIKPGGGPILFSAAKSSNLTSSRSSTTIDAPFVLQFFNHAEGYIKPVIASGSAAISSFEYIYQYKDHLGNIRLSYTDNDKNGVIDAATEIIEESNYYPFGLRHKGYNNIVNSLGDNKGQKYKTFQGQEYHDELGLNVNEFKYRFYDPSYARFWSIDPLAEDFAYNATYAFAENKIGMGMELEGRELLPNQYMFEIIRWGYQGVQNIKEKFSSGAKKVTKAHSEQMRQKAGVPNAEFDSESNRIDMATGIGEMSEAFTDSAHLTADLAGAIDPSGIVDGVHSLTYLTSGDYGNAGLTAMGAFAYFGDAFKSAKYLKYGDEAANLVKTTGKVLDKETGKLGKEIITELNDGTLENGLKVANDIIGDLGDGAVPKFGKFGSQEGIQVGFQSANGKKGWRIDYDFNGTIGTRGHINWWNGKEKGAILIKAGEQQINQIIKNSTFK
ncbi:DUF6443 domain-containing protein [Tenacibaculum sp. M341]|uniref:DUF6443 domain-containing protein n=1 Tax=Tenacibaculum sp. M341 TaxID=2530339 RepID=UPI001045B872|nr:DUF6443 domain-containing protein [Tenacibaculum sp. M341]TCI85061.1 type IV secretion protein Rhs [Tenacibaculum sp. M341]